MLLLTLLALWAVLLIAPETPIACFLHKIMVAAPAAVIARITRGHLLLALSLVVLVTCVGWWLEADGLRMLGMAAPEIASWIVVFDVVTYLDVAAALAIAASTMRVRAARAYVVSFLPRRNGRPVRRAARAPRSRPARPSAANDDSDGHGLRLAS